MLATLFNRTTGFAIAAAAALTIAASAASQAAPAGPGAGIAIRDAVPGAASDVRWHGRRYGYGPRFHRPYRPYRPYGFYRPYRPAYFGGPVYGPRCFWRPAREVFTPYGVRFVPARRVCRY